MILDMVCPDIAELGLRNRKGAKPYNFNLDHCQKRFVMRAAGCIRCPEGTHWFIERMMT
jgi:hypothetical protein